MLFMQLNRLLAVLPFTLLPSLAEQSAVCDKPFQADFRSGGVLTMNLRVGDIVITGTDSPNIRVTCHTTNGSEDVRFITASFQATGPNGTLMVRGGNPTDGLKLHIEVPRRTHLSLRCNAGDVKLTGIRGDKFIALKAGDLNVDVGDPAEYAEIEASVRAGDLDLTAFGVRKGGLLRRFRKSQKTGSYNLRATLWAGNITFR